jgi:hypothetical protein
VTDASSSLLFTFSLHLFTFCSINHSTYSCISFWTFPLFFYLLACFKNVPTFT